MALTDGQSWGFFLLMSMQYEGTDPITHIPIFRKSRFRTDVETAAGQPGATFDSAFRAVALNLLNAAYPGGNNQYIVAQITQVNGFDYKSLNVALGLPYAGPGPCPPGPPDPPVSAAIFKALADNYVSAVAPRKGLKKR